MHSHQNLVAGMHGIDGRDQLRCDLFGTRFKRARLRFAAKQRKQSKRNRQWTKFKHKKSRIISNKP